MKNVLWILLIGMVLLFGTMCTIIDPNIGVPKAKVTVDGIPLPDDIEVAVENIRYTNSSLSSKIYYLEYDLVSNVDNLLVTEVYENEDNTFDVTWVANGFGHSYGSSKLTFDTVSEVEDDNCVTVEIYVTFDEETYKIRTFTVCDFYFPCWKLELISVCVLN